MLCFLKYIHVSMRKILKNEHKNKDNAAIVFLLFAWRGTESQSRL